MRLGLCCCLIGVMGLLFGKLDKSRNDESIHDKEFTPQEKERLILLGTTAGSPGMVMEAIQSGDIFDPKHMERAQELNKQWEDSAAIFAPYLEKQKRIDAEREQLRQMGLRMEGKPKSSTYEHIEASIGDLGLPTEEWFLRIESSSGEYVDLKLSPHQDVIADSLIDACHVVPRFNAVLHRPDKEPVVIFSHLGVVE